MRWLVISVVLSVVLTVLLNVGARAFPDAFQRAARGLEGMAGAGHAPESGRRVRVIVPWRAMILASVVLTIVINLLLWMT